MRASLCILFISGVLCLVFSFSAEQTNWSDGPSVWGPVISFGTDFYLDTDVRWLTTDETLNSSFYDTETLIKPNQHSYRVLAADLDLDGYQDLLFSAAPTTYLIGACYNQSSGSSWNSFTLFSGDQKIEWFGISDIDGDGDLDVTGTQWGNIIWLENPAIAQGDWNVHAVPYTLSSNIGLPADMDNDGDYDLVGRTNMYTLRWYENLDGTGDLWEEKLISTVDEICLYSMSDINGDGLCDVVATRNLPGEVIWLEHPAPGSDDWIYHEITTSFSRPFEVVSVDIDGDDDIDIAVSSYPSSFLAIFENSDGLGTEWSQRFVSTDVTQINQLSAVDYDLDGDPDLLAGTFGYGARLFENMDGTGNTWFAYSFQSCSNYPRGACSEDFNGDGELDFAFGGTGYDNRLKWCTLDYVTGSLESNLLDTEIAADWGSISWTGIEPASTAIGFQVRSSSSPEVGQMPAWSDTLWNPCSLEGILTDGHRYVQYRAILLTDNVDSTAVLKDVTISWNDTGISSENEDEAFMPVFTIASNPSSGEVIIYYSLQQPSPVSISLYDICGRLQRENVNEDMPTGTHTIYFSELTPGVYCFKMTAGGSMQTEMVTIIE